MLGVPFDSLTLAQALARIEKMIDSRRAHYIVTANVDFLVQARRDLELRRILVEADLALCDGMPLVWASRCLGNPLPERVAGADLVPKLIERAAVRNYRLFFLGGKPEVTAKAVANLQQQYPNLVIAGHFSPPFRPLLEMPNQEIVRRIRAAKPDVLLVSFGCPKAEKWMAMHCQSLGVPVIIGIGGTIDFLAGALKRAPDWIQRIGMEWLFRLVQEPRRLARRYGTDLWHFSGAILQQWWKLQGRLWNRRPIPPTSAVVVDPTWQRIRVPDRFDRDAIGRAPHIWEEGAERHHLIELANVNFIDSTAIALLVRLEKRLRLAGWQLVLLEPSRAVQRAFKLMGLENHFLTAADGLEARKAIDGRSQEEAALALNSSSASQPVLIWKGEITARNALQIWYRTKREINSLAQWRKEFELDLSAVRYLDSAGLRLMLRVKKHAQRRGATLTFKGLSPAVQNALRIAQLQPVLLESAA
jgi:N-acetylglucosaminyldiphosphoundecaprenol N-acetyl-beta-D-mannosaminyltransferase